MIRWLRATRGTLASITALTKNKPGRLMYSVRDALPGNRKLFVENAAGGLDALAWESHKHSPADLIGLNAAVTGLFSGLLGANGYQILPSGLIIQWGTKSLYAGRTDVSFPIVFPNDCFVAIPVAGIYAPDLEYHPTYPLTETKLIVSFPTRYGFETNLDPVLHTVNARFYSWVAIGN